ncbi:MAG: GNAT family N-acetyltransferase, partial [Albidovulum sp.]
LVIQCQLWGRADRQGLIMRFRTFHKYVVIMLVMLLTSISFMGFAASPLKARLAVIGGEVAGFAIRQHHPSTWVMGEDCYLEDLFVAEIARGHGAGRALIDDLRTLAKAKGWHRLYWHTDRNNARARALYDSYVEEDGHVRYRMTL